MDLVTSVLSRMRLHRQAYDERPPSFLVRDTPQTRLQAVLTDDLLRLLNNAFFNDGVLDRALESIDNRLVCRVTCPAGMVIHQVRTSQPRDKSSTASSNSEAVFGLHDSCYTVVDGFCSCYDYHKRVILGGTQRQYCKHNLAVALAEAVGLPPNEAGGTGSDATAHTASHGGSASRRSSVSSATTNGARGAAAREQQPQLRTREISDVEMAKLLAAI